MLATLFAGPPRRRRRGERGQAVTEYMLVALAAASALFLPVFDGKSVFVLLLEVFDIYLDSMHTVITLPVP